MSVETSPLTIGALAERADCNVPTIRYYEEIGLLQKAGRRPSGHRVYREADVKRLTFIRRCREFQFPLEKVRELVDLIEDPERDCNAAKQLAEEHLIVVRKKLAELLALEESLSQFAENCSSLCAGGPSRECVILEDLSSTTSKCC